MIEDSVQKLDGIPGFEDTYFILIALMLAFGFLQTMGTALDTERPAVSVISPSMCPEIHVGDILVVKGSDYDDIEVNDVIVYDVPDRAEITLGNSEYILEGEGDSVSTEMGKLKLQDVVPARERSVDGVAISLNGKDLREENGELFKEGRAYEIAGGQRLEIDYATSLPFDNTPIVHRVVEKSDGSFETMGDANSGQIEFEKNVSIDQIYGKQVFKIPRLGLLKLVVMDLTGLQGEPLRLDSTPSC